VATLTGKYSTLYIVGKISLSTVNKKLARFKLRFRLSENSKMNELKNEYLCDYFIRISEGNKNCRYRKKQC